jgi:ATP-binding cassette subfamily B (MDR/TAP) protein 1
MLRQDMTFFDNTNNTFGALSSKLNSETKKIRLTAGQSLATTLQCLAALVAAFSIAIYGSWQIFLVMLAMFPLLTLGEALEFVSLTSTEAISRKVLHRCEHRLSEAIQSIREVQAYALEDILSAAIFVPIRDIVSKQQAKTAVVSGLMMGAIELIELYVYAFAFWVGGRLVANGTLTFAQFSLSLWAMTFGASGLGRASAWGARVAKAKGSISAIFYIIDRVPPIDARPWTRIGTEYAATGFEPSEPRVIEQNLVSELRGEVELKNVYFSYPSRTDARIFNDLSLKIPASQTVAFCGESGSGKSSIVQLIERFYDPCRYERLPPASPASIVPLVSTEGGLDGEDGLELVQVKYNEAGSCSLDKVEYSQLDVRWLRNEIGLVSQEPVLFSASVLDNILMGKPNCTKEEAIEAAKVANAHSFIMSLRK